MKQLSVRVPCTPRLKIPPVFQRLPWAQMLLTQHRRLFPLAAPLSAEEIMKNFAQAGLILQKWLQYNYLHKTFLHCGMFV